MMVNNSEYYKRFKTETIYLLNKEEGAYVKSVPGKGFFAKFKGEEEYEVAEDSNMVTLAFDGQHEVSKKTYDSA